MDTRMFTDCTATIPYTFRTRKSAVRLTFCYSMHFAVQHCIISKRVVKFLKEEWNYQNWD